MLYGSDLWPYCKYTFSLLEKQTDTNIIQIAKQILLENFEDMAQFLDQQIVENELIYIVEKNYLTLS